MWAEGDAVIRQAISCDICATEKKQTNHWFVAYEQAGELRVSGLDPRSRLRTGTKHLCGQTCLHKLVDEFISKALAAPLHADAAQEPVATPAAVPTDTSLTSNAAGVQAESPVRLVTPTALLPSRMPPRAQPELVAMAPRLLADDSSIAPGEPPRYASRNWRAEAWEREREREMQAGQGRQDRLARRRSGS
jgi:hypothetical protein